MTITETNPHHLRHPAFASFWAHARHACIEVPGHGSCLEFLQDHPELLGDSLEEALADGWISAVRWTGDEDFWLVRCGELERASQLIAVWVGYVLARRPDSGDLRGKDVPGRYPAEGDTELRIQAATGPSARFPLREAAARLGALRRVPLPDRPGAVLLEVQRDFGRGCCKPHDFAHHPALPGLWLHADKGRFYLPPGTHARDFFADHPEIFGDSLEAAYQDGWVFVRRWTGYREEWRIRYGTLAPVLGVLTAWAEPVVAEHPDEALIPVKGIPAFEPTAPRGTLADLAAGSITAKEHEEACLPPPEAIQRKREELDARGKDGNDNIPEWSALVWPDYAAPADPAFAPFDMNYGDDADYFRLENLIRRLEDIQQPRSRSWFEGTSNSREHPRLKSWIHQLQTGEAPLCTGDGYREWLGYLRGN